MLMNSLAILDDKFAEPSISKELARYRLAGFGALVHLGTFTRDFAEAKVIKEIAELYIMIFHILYDLLSTFSCST